MQGEQQRLDADHWRTRAAEMRELAEQMTNDLARSSLLRIAADYEKAADRAEARSKSEPNSRKP